MAGLKVKIGADASQFERTMRGVRKDIGGVKSAIMGVGGAVGAIWAVNKAFDGMRAAARGAFDFIKSASDEAASMESISIQFETLLGSTTKAKKRMEDLVEFAKTTPFEIKGLAEASSMLQGMTGGALASGAGLRMVGDAAAAVNKPLEVVGMNIGKLFQGLTQGGEVAEATNQLMQYGLVTGKAKIALQDFVKEAKAGKRQFFSEAEALEVLNKMLGQTEGAMARLAETTEGKKSMVKDAMDQIKVAFGTGFNDGLKVALDAATNFIPQFQDKMKIAGNSVGTAIADAVQGDSTKLIAIGQLIGTYFAEGIEKTVTKMVRLMLNSGAIGASLNALGVDTSFGMLKSQSEISEGYAQTRKTLGQSISDQTQMQDNTLDREKTFMIGNQRWRYQSESAQTKSPYFDGSTGKRIVEVLEKVAQNTEPGFSTP